MFRCAAGVAFLVLGAIMTISVAADADKAVEQAQTCLKKRDFKGALKATDEAVKIDPKSAEAWFLRGEANGGLRNSDEAIKDFDKTLELDPKFSSAINQRGGERFKLGDIKGSIEDFEKFIKIHPKAYDDHWRYGISLYYAGRFADGAKQFKAGEKAFGNDVENAFFHYICNARDNGVEKARQNILVIGPDARIPMMKIYDLIKGKAKADDVIETAEKAKLDAEDKNEALFYGHLYVGLNYEAEGNTKKCIEHLTTAVEKHKIGHYMWDVGNVHLKQVKKK
jgi:lipoprotein NlpI